MMPTRISDLEVDELLALLRDELRLLARQAVREALSQTSWGMVTFPPPVAEALRGQPLNFPVDEVGPWPTDLSLRREDLYDVDGR